MMDSFYLTYLVPTHGYDKIEPSHVGRRQVTPSNYESMSIFSVFRPLLAHVLKCENVALKKVHYLYEGGIEKSIPLDHRLSSLGKPRDANR